MHSLDDPGPTAGRFRRLAVCLLVNLGPGTWRIEWHVSIPFERLFSLWKVIAEALVYSNEITPLCLIPMTRPSVQLLTPPPSSSEQTVYRRPILAP